MSEIALTSTPNYDYTNGSMMINPGLVQKTTNTPNESTSSFTEQQQQYSTYPAYAFQPMSMEYPPVPNYQMSRLPFFKQPNSPESITSSPTPSPPPPSSKNRFNNPTTARVKEMITRANSVPMEFYHTEFLEYSKETYEKKMESKRNKRKRTGDEDQVEKKQKVVIEEREDTDDEFDDEKLVDDSAEIRRQIHIQSEQKRRAQIKDGFDELRKHLPGCNNKKMSKAALLTRTVQQLQHLKGMQNELLSEVERLLQENEALKNVQQQQMEEEEDDDECAFISGQHCDQGGICKYCAMCLQSSCILSKSIGTTAATCNTTQFGTTNLYDWYDYCLSSDNDNSGSYCATSTECYQYKKSARPTVSYAWHNLTCNPSTCMLVASNGTPPPIPLPPQPNLPYDNANTINRIKHNPTHGHDIANATDRHRYYHDKHPFHNPAAIALTVVCSLVLVILIGWLFRLFKKKGWWPFQGSLMNRRLDKKTRQTAANHPASMISSVPSSAPPSFSSVPPDMAIIRHPHLPLPTTLQPSIHSTRSSTSVEPLPSYLSPYPLPPKYEQAIVTQIRDLRDDHMGSSAGSSMDQYHHGATAPSMWVPVYFTQQQSNFRRGVNTGQVFGFTPNHSYWLQQLTQEQAIVQGSSSVDSSQADSSQALVPVSSTRVSSTQMPSTQVPSSQETSSQETSSQTPQTPPS
ncbi:hypothetical protein MFLAVUS_005872 [Mucor flavus]|uniref:BHLH domain-containing protein n=1 Tax=Mucor flavus TaxID=439312 RepID=A0ABP9YZZ6_9FUNG